MDIQKIIGRMSLEDKIAFCTGADMWRTKTMEQYGIGGIMMSDGPHGLRCQKDETDFIGINKSLPATCFPTAVTSGATWDEELLAAEGEAIGREARAVGVSVVLGPGCNIKRNPLGGRSFEYFSEDPYIAGRMAAAYIRGQQATGVSSSLKHFAVNSQEYKRQNGDSQVDERALQEIYLAPFETAVREARPGTVMCSYNKINGIHASDNRWLLTEVLRDEWGFDGAVVTDWGALYDRIEAFKAGCDLNMPGGSVYMEKAAVEAVRSGALSEADIDACIERILRLVENSPAEPGAPADFDAHHELARRIAEAGAVLLKNEGILPLALEDAVFIGYMCEKTRYQGAGSSHINPVKLVNVRDAMPDNPYYACCDEAGNVTEETLRKAADLARTGKAAVVFAGLPESYESEALDRENMRLPEGHNRMIEAVAAANPNTVVVLFGGGAMELPWADQVKAILYMGLPGEAAGEAVRSLLSGEAVPSGKLTETWPVRYADVISRDTFGKKNVEYRESIYVGYRYYDKAGVPVRYPFGHGLSYTTFDYSDLTVDGRKVTAKITNTGTVKGAEVVQLYIAPPQDGIFRPVKELKGFRRVELEPGETKPVEFTLDDRSFAVWEDGWKVPGGTYQVLLGSSCSDIRLSRPVRIDGSASPEISGNAAHSWYYTLQGAPSRTEWEDLMGHSVPLQAEPRKGEYTMDNTCLEMKDHSLVMKIQYKVTEAIIAKSFGGRKDMNDPAFKMMMTAATDAPMRAAVIASAGAMPENLAKGLLEMANGHFIKGIAAMLKK